MGKLNQIAQGIQIGNLEVYNFLDYAVNRECGGILSYTNKNEFLNKNLSNNPGRGNISRSRRYDMSDIAPTGSFGVNGNSLLGELTSMDSGIHAESSSIGDYYSIKYDEKELKFMLPETFALFQENLRNKNIEENYSWYESGSGTTSFYVNETPETYLVNGFDKNAALETIVKSDKRGSLYEVKKYNRDNKTSSLNILKLAALTNQKYYSNINKNIAVKKGRSVGYSSESEYKPNEERNLGTTKAMSIYNVKDKVSDRTFYKLNSLDEAAANQRSSLITSGLIGQNTFMIEKLKGLKNDVGGSLLFEAFYNGINTTDLKNKLSNINFNKTGLFESYSEIRKGYTHSLNSIKYPSTLLEIDGFWRRSVQYAITTESGGEEGFDTYNVGQENNFSEVEISPDFLDQNSRMLINAKKLIDEQKVAFDVSQMRGEEVYKGDGTDEYVSNRRRSWTAYNQYKYLNNLIRPIVGSEGKQLSIFETQKDYGRLRPNGGRILSNNSVLKNDGFVRISPEHIGGKFVDTKKYMFSIENLAWRDAQKSLSHEQVGPNNGRIMWFPPYNLKFSENINVNWSENNFIGRGEGIYTYVNTNRGGTLDFTLLIDHPSSVNKWRGTGEMVDELGQYEQDIIDYFSGLKNLDLTSEKTEDDDSVINSVATAEEDKETKPTQDTKKIAYVIFFPQCYSGANKKTHEIQELLRKFNKGEKINTKDNTDFDRGMTINRDCNGVKLSTVISDVKKQILNCDEDIDIRSFEDLITIDEEFTDNEIFGLNSETFEVKNVEFIGYESSIEDDGKGILMNRRRNSAKALFRSICTSINENETMFIDANGTPIGSYNTVQRLSVNLNSKEIQAVRAACITVELGWKDDVKPNPEVSEEASDAFHGSMGDEPQVKNDDENVNEVLITTSLSEEYSYDNEYLYFSNLRGDSNEYKRIIDKVKYFNPAYHSITPEGFNARLTFLQQCTRQGPTNSVSGGLVRKNSTNYQKYAGNMAFGRAPYCVLRIGDFFNTKICIESISIAYDNNGVQWDLNPEGAGVQPMYANVSISFKFIGGQDLSGPVERLQNAVTANYYANASVYSKHADTKNKYYDAITDKQENKKKY